MCSNVKCTNVLAVPSSMLWIDITENNMRYKRQNTSLVAIINNAGIYNTISKIMQKPTNHYNNIELLTLLLVSQCLLLNSTLLLHVLTKILPKTCPLFSDRALTVCFFQFTFLVQLFFINRMSI